MLRPPPSFPPLPSYHSNPLPKAPIPDTLISAMTNLTAMVATRILSQHTLDMSQSMQRMATGKRINRASDDPAGMVKVTELSIEQVKVTKQIERLQWAQARYGAKDGAESVLTDSLQELQGLVTQAANGDLMSNEERRALQVEADGILHGINFLATTSIFNGQQIMSERTTGNLGSSPADEYSLADLALGGSLNLFDGDLKTAQNVIDRALDDQTLDRAAAGAAMRDAESQVRELSVRLEELTGARSKIEDTDFAREVSEYMRASLLQQVGQQVLKNALQSHSQTVLTLVG